MIEVVGDVVFVPMVLGRESVGTTVVDLAVAEELDLLHDSGFVTAPNGTHALHRGVSLHRLVVGLYPRDKGVVHHLNGKPWDNRKENLWVCADNTEHRVIWHGHHHLYWRVAKVAREYQAANGFKQPNGSLYSDVLRDPYAPYDDINVFMGLLRVIGFHVGVFPDRLLDEAGRTQKAALTQHIYDLCDIYEPSRRKVAA